MSERARYFIAFVVGGVAGMAYDMIHVVFGVLSYEHPHFAGTSWLVLPEFGAAALIGAGLARAMARKVSPPAVSVGRLVFDSFWLLVAYLVTGFFAGQNSLTFFILLPMAIITVATRPSRFVLIGAAAAAIAGPLGEFAFSRAGFFHYNVAAWVPSWLPLLWIVASGAFVSGAVVLFKNSPEAPRRPAPRVGARR